MATNNSNNNVNGNNATAITPGEQKRQACNANVERLGTITLEDLRWLAEPATGFDSFGRCPVYIRMGDKYYPVADFSTVSGPYGSRVEIQVGEGMTQYELAKKQKQVREGR